MPLNFSPLRLAQGVSVVLLLIPCFSYAFIPTHLKTISCVGCYCGLVGGMVMFWLLKHFESYLHVNAKRIILVRHGESIGNVDVTAYVRL
jgi:hypothetical protein